MVCNVSRRLRRISEVEITATQVRLRGGSPHRHQAPGALSRLKTEVTDKTNLVRDLPVAMTNETEEQENVGTKYFD